MKAMYVLALVAMLAAPAFGRDLLQAPAAAITDADVLNFALNLECLEAEFYSFAAFGSGLNAADRGNGPASTGGQKALLSAEIQAYAEETANNEIAHVRFLRAALGSAAVACPAMNIGTAFSMAANAAVNATLSPAFSPYGSDLPFLHGAFIFEDVGVTAYKGAAPLIANKTYLSAAAGILAVEAYHAGSIRTLLAQNLDTYVYPYGVTVATIIDAISALRAAVGGGADLGLLSPVGSAPVTPTQTVTADGQTLSLTIVPADANAIAFGRTPAQVLAIVTLGSATNMGGFFPSGVNGNIK